MILPSAFSAQAKTPISPNSPPPLPPGSLPALPSIYKQSQATTPAKPSKTDKTTQAGAGATKEDIIATKTGDQFVPSQPASPAAGLDAAARQQQQGVSDKFRLPFVQNPTERAEAIIKILPKQDNPADNQKLADGVKKLVHELDALSLETFLDKQKVFAELKNSLGKDFKLETLLTDNPEVTSGKKPEDFLPIIEGFAQFKEREARNLAAMAKKVDDYTATLQPGTRAQLRYALLSSSPAADVTAKERAGYILKRLPKQESEAAGRQLSAKLENYLVERDLLKDNLVEKNPELKHSFKKDGHPFSYVGEMLSVVHGVDRAEHNSALKQFESDLCKHDEKFIATLPPAVRQAWKPDFPEALPETVTERTQFALGRLPRQGSPEKEKALKAHIEELMASTDKALNMPLPKPGQLSAIPPEMNTLVAETAKTAEKVSNFMLTLSQETQRAFDATSASLEKHLTRQQMTRLKAAFAPRPKL